MVVTKIPYSRIRGLVIFWAVAWITACTAFADGAFQGPPLNVGMELNYPPFEMTDQAGKPSGVSVDLASALGLYLHRKVRISNTPYERLIPALKTGRVDLIISSMTITQDRERLIDFSDPYCRSGLALLLKKDATFNSIDDLNTAGAMVAVKTGTTGDIYAQAHLQKASILRFQEADSCALSLAEGKADAFIYDQLSVIKYNEKYPDQSRMNLQSFREEPWGIGLAKGNDDLKNQVNAFLADFRSKGGFTELDAKYFAKEKKIFDDLGLPFYF